MYYIYSAAVRWKKKNIQSVSFVVVDPTVVMFWEQ